MKTEYFDKDGLERVDRAGVRAEELVNNFFKLSPAQWLNNRYDIKTAASLAPHERVDGPFAQVLKYEGQTGDVPLISSSFSLYHVCLQDGAILLQVSLRPDLRLDPFLLYILVHELVHVVRFSRFEHRYENACEADVTLEEEKKVHGLTCQILDGVMVSGMIQVIDFFNDCYGCG